VDRSHRNPGFDTKVSCLCGWLRSDRNQRWVLVLGVRPITFGTHRVVRGFPVFRGKQVRPVCPHPFRNEKALMNKELSLDEQREFWTQLFAVVIRREARKRADFEVTLELLQDVRQTEPSQL
jgi:hypothetical protein